MKIFRHTTRNVGRNPVARAVQRTQIATTVRDMRTRLLMLADGEPAQADIQTCATVIAFTARVLELRGLLESPDARVLRGALSALSQMTRGRWAAGSALAIDEALRRVADLARGTTADEAAAAWAFVRSIE